MWFYDPYNSFHIFNSYIRNYIYNILFYITYEQFSEQDLMKVKSLEACQLYYECPTCSEFGIRASKEKKQNHAGIVLNMGCCCFSFVVLAPEVLLPVCHHTNLCTVLSQFTQNLRAARTITTRDWINEWDIIGRKRIQFQVWAYSKSSKHRHSKNH